MLTSRLTDKRTNTYETSVAKEVKYRRREMKDLVDNTRNYKDHEKGAYQVQKLM